MISTGNQIAAVGLLVAPHCPIMTTPSCNVQLLVKFNVKSNQALESDDGY